MKGFCKSARDHIRRHETAYLVLLICLIPTVIAHQRVSINVRNRAEARFNEAVFAVEALLEQRISRAVDNLFSVRGLFDAARMEPERWTRFVENLHERHPAAHVMGYLGRLPEDGEEAVVRLEQGGPFAVRHQSDFGGAGLSEGGLHADPVRQQLLQEAARTGQAMATDRVTLAGPGREGFVIYVPVYRRTVLPGNDEDRMAALRGFVFGAYSVERLLEGIQPDGAELIHLSIHDGPPAGEESLLYRSGPAEGARHLARVRAFPVLNRTWRLQFQSLPDIAGRFESYLPALVLAVGLAVSVLLFTLTCLEIRRRRAAEALSAQVGRSQETLRRANEQLTVNIVQRDTAESLLAYERDLLRALLDHSPDRIYFKDLESRFLKCSAEVGRHLKVAHPDHAVGRSDFDFFTEEHARQAYEDEQRIIRTGEPLIGIVEKETWHGGPETWVLTTKMPLRDNDGKIVGTFGTSKDITPLKTSEEALAREKERLTVTLRSIGDAVISADMDGRIVLFNKVAETLTGWTQGEATQRALRDVCHLLDERTRCLVEDPIQKVIHAGEGIEASQNAVLISRDGIERIVAHNAAPIHDKDGQTIGVVLVIRDMTEKQKIEAELIQASKLESVGVLAGGIAHDFNNILTSVIGHLSLARLCTHSLDTLLARIDDAERAAMQARDLTQQLLTFSKGGEPIKKSINLNAPVRNITQLALRGGNVKCEFFLDPDLWPVEADEAQIGQAVNNLVINSREAMPDGGKIEVKTENIHLNDNFLPALAGGRHVRITIRDHGAGIAPEHLPKIFDPYFTTKQHGTGMGLAAAYSIVRKHGGQIEAESTPGAGSTFYICLPASVSLPETGPHQTRLLGKGRILVMDDEEDIRMLVGMMLETIGYEVETARDGAEAIELYARAMKDQRRFDAVIMDLTVPNGMGGKETIVRMRQIDPDVKAIVSSGYSYDPVMGNFREHGFSGVVPKPYRVEDIARALRELLEGNAQIPAP